jgi:hypothetical protein
MITKQAGLAKLHELLASITADLRAMPEFKRGTAWHTDRVAELCYLIRAIERLEAHHAATAQR